MNKKLRIDYPTGYMEFYITAMLPCVEQKAKILFPLINNYCSKEEKDELRDLFHGLIEYCEGRNDEWEYRHSYKKNKTTLARARANLRRLK